jgi:hypothetical protein
LCQHLLVLLHLTVLKTGRSKWVEPPSWCYTTNNVSTILNHLRSMESSFASCKSLNNYLESLLTKTLMIYIYDFYFLLQRFWKLFWAFYDQIR